MKVLQVLVGLVFLSVSVFGCTPETCPTPFCKEAGCSNNACVYSNKQCNSCPSTIGTKADFVFIIDTSGSMSDNINAVASGLSQFVDSLVGNGVDPQFAVALENLDLEMYQTFTSSIQTTKNTFNEIAQSVSGYWEAGLEAIRLVLHQATLNAIPRSGPYAVSVPDNRDMLAWRQDAIWSIVLVTDEDADRPALPENETPGQASTSRQDPGGDISTPWQLEIERTKNAVLATNANVFMLINPAEAGGSVASTRQYGDTNYQSQWSSFSHFNPAITYANLEANNREKSLQGLILNAGAIARVFDIRDVNDPNFIKNFFNEITQSVRLCDACIISVCDIADGVCKEVSICNDDNLCTVDTCTAVGDYGECTFTEMVCPPSTDLCKPTKCDPLTGTCDKIEDVVCNQISSEPCKIFACNPSTGLCEEGPNICPITVAVGDDCFLDVCTPGVGCEQVANSTGLGAAGLGCGDPPEVIVLPPSKPPKKNNKAAIAGGVLAALVIIGILAVIIAIWKIKTLKSDIAQLDAFCNGADVNKNALYREGTNHGTNPLYDQH